MLAITIKIDAVVDGERHRIISDFLSELVQPFFLGN